MLQLSRTTALLTAVTEVPLKSPLGICLWISELLLKTVTLLLMKPGWFWNVFEGLYAAKDGFVLPPFQSPCSGHFPLHILRCSGVLQVQP